jgi:probable HAF family extracellular repeat protein
MLMRLKFHLLLLALVFVIAPTLTAAAQDVTYTFETIDPPDSELTILSGINNAGEIVGTYRDADKVIHGFLFSEGEFTIIDYPDATTTFAAGINDEGQIVGNYADSEGTAHAFLLVNGEFTDVDLPDATTASAINNAGEILGTYSSDDDIAHAFTLIGEEFTTIDYPDMPNTFGNGINDAGYIVGDTYCDSCDKRPAFVLQDEEFAGIEFPEAYASGAKDINNSDIIVGNYYEADSSQFGYDALKPRGFILDPDGNFTPIDFPDAKGTSPNAINDDGVIVGFYRDADNKSHGFRAILG